MKRIDSLTADTDKHGSGKNGFQDPASGTPTNVNFSWFDAVQEEIANTVEASGQALSSSNDGQLRQVLLRMCVSQWSYRDDQSSTDTWGAIAYGTRGSVPGGMFQAVSSTADFLRENGTDSAGSTQLNDICFGSGTYWVAVGEIDGGGDATLIRWDDADFFSNRSNPQNVALNCVASDGSSSIVALGDHDGTDIYCIRSTDHGSTWSEVAVTGAAGDYIQAVCWGGSQYVAAGWDNTAGAPAFWTSSDGTSWTKRSAHASATEAPVDICWTGTNYVCVAADVEIFTSSDGITWTYDNPLNGYTISGMKGVASWPDTGLVVAVGAVPTAYGITPAGGIASFDHGATWEFVDAIPTNATGIAFGGGRFAVVVADGTNARLAYSGGIVGAG